jgi:hypothetical protein
MSAASRETERSRYKASGNAAPATGSNVSAAAHTNGSRHTRRPLDVPRGRFANTTSSLPASSCSISGELTPIWNLKLHIRMRTCKPTEGGRQRTSSNFFDCSKAHGAGKWRRCKAVASRFFQLQQAARVTQEHLAVIGQGHRSGGATKKRSLGLELKTLDLLAHGRLREVQLFGRAVEAPAFSHGNKRTQQLEFHHGD